MATKFDIDKMTITRALQLAILSVEDDINDAHVANQRSTKDELIKALHILRRLYRLAEVNERVRRTMRIERDITNYRARRVVVAKAKNVV